MHWQTQRDARLAALRSIYRRGDLALFIGAGASMGAGLPRWSQVLDELIEDLIAQAGDVRDEPVDITPEECRTIAQGFFKRHSASPLYAARYLRAAFGDGFEQRLADALYCPRGEACSPDVPPVLAAIAELARHRLAGIVTYNYDDLLERALDREGVGFETLLSQRRRSNALPIYHVHGFLPREPVPTSAASLLVFSEERYHEIYARPDHWSNVVQLSMLRERSCAFIGLSLQDPNLRRLLELATRSADCPQHYVFLRRTTPREVGEALRPEVARAIIDAHHHMQERSLAELGLEVIWVDGHDELPELLAKLASSALGSLDAELVHTPVERLATHAE